MASVLNTMQFEDRNLNVKNTMRLSQMLIMHDRRCRNVSYLFQLNSSSSEDNYRI